MKFHSKNGLSLVSKTYTFKFEYSVQRRSKITFMYCNLENLQKIPMKKLAFGKYHDNKRLNLIQSVRSFLSFQNYSQCLFPSVSCDKDFWSS